MEVLILDIELMGLPFALRCAESGHSVRLYRHMPKRKERYGQGFKNITLVDDWRQHMARAKDGLIVLTGNYALTHELDRYREFGYPIFAPTPQSARLEIDRLAGMRAAEAAGIAVPEYHLFNNLQETLVFAKKAQDPFCFKPSGDEDSKQLTYVAHDPDDLVGWLERQIKSGKKMKQCMLQKKIPVVSELGVSAWFGPEGHLPYYGVSIEHKKLMPGEIGPNTGEQGTVCQWVEEDKLADEMLKPFDPILRALGHRGDFSVGAIVDDLGKAWFLEVTARLGYPAFFIQLASMRGDPVRWMKDLLNSKDSVRVSHDVAIGVVCAQPPYPYTHDVPRELVEGNPIQGVDDVGDNVHLCSVMRDRTGKYETTGQYVLVCTGLGKTIERCRGKVYDTVKAIRFPDMMYRDDIGLKVEKCLSKMHKFGYLSEMS